jgi:hypothetical protein
MTCPDPIFEDASALNTILIVVKGMLYPVQSALQSTLT